MKFGIKPHTISFTHAWDGIAHAFVTQPNLRIHFSIGLLVMLAGYYFQITKIEWLVLLFVILWVVVSEMINTAIESIVDLITTERRLDAKVAKDVAAGVVLVGAIGSVAAGLIIFIPYILKRI